MTLGLLLDRARNGHDRATHYGGSRAFLAGSNLVPASGSQVAAAGDRWLLTAVRGHLGDTPGLVRPRPALAQRSESTRLPAMSFVSVAPKVAPGRPGRSEPVPACALTRTFRPVGSSRHRRPTLRGSGPGPPGPAGAPYWTNDLDLEGLVCSALPGRTVMG